MDDRTTAGSPYRLDQSDSISTPVGDRGPSWEQLSALPPNYLIIEPKLVISGTEGMLTASITVSDFWSSERIACEVRPALRYPQDLHVTLLWLEERILHFSSGVAPF